jgi:hypothetical protein
MTSLVAFVDRTLGRCPRCMRKSFLAALAAWAMVFVADAMRVPSAAGMALTLVSLGLSALWLAHVAAFAGRATAAAMSKGSSGATMPTSSPLRSRREVAIEFARTTAFVALATALSTKVALACVQPPKSCSANSDCTCSQCCGDLAGIHVCQPSC